MGTIREIVPFFAVEEIAMIGLPPLERDAPAQKVHLPADAAVEEVADGIGTDLAGEIDLQRRVDRHHVVVAGDQCGVIGIGRGMELENRIVVHEIEQVVSCPGQIPE